MSDITYVQAISSNLVVLQIPPVLPAGAGHFEIFNPDYPMIETLVAFSHNQHVVEQCFGSLHQNFDRLVSREDPAIPGEIIHVFLTGLAGDPDPPYGIPNPIDRLVPATGAPPLGDPGAANVIFFGLAPGLIGIQQLDLQIIRPFKDGYLFNYSCAAPAISAVQ
jgi:uncharacterized protein (TIGR03437 family)